MKKEPTKAKEECDEENEKKWVPGSVKCKKVQSEKRQTKNMEVWERRDKRNIKEREAENLTGSKLLNVAVVV